MMDWFRLMPEEIKDELNRVQTDPAITSEVVLETISRTDWAKMEPTCFQVLKSWFAYIIEPVRTQNNNVQRK